MTNANLLEMYNSVDLDVQNTTAAINISASASNIAQVPSDACLNNITDKSLLPTKPSNRNSTLPTLEEKDDEDSDGEDKADEDNHPIYSANLMHGEVVNGVNDGRQNIDGAEGENVLDLSHIHEVINDDDKDVQDLYSTVVKLPKH